MSEVLFFNSELSYEYFQNENVCRLCWNKEGSLDIFPETSENPLFLKIKDCLNIQLDKESFPTKACDRCFKKVEEFYEFKSLCQDAEKRLQEILNKFNEKAERKNYEVKIENDSSLFLDTKESDTSELPVEFENTHCISNYENNKNDITINESKCSHKNGEIENCFVNESDYYTPDLDEDFNEKELAGGVGTKEDKIIAECSLKNEGIEPSCNSSIEDKVLLKVKKKYRQKRSPTYCNICRTDLGSKEKFALHNASNHGIEAGNQFKCFGCEKRFKTRKARLAHEINFCKGLKEGYKCGKCNRFLPRRSMYEAHMRDHRENPDVELPENIFQCVKCFKLFKTKLCLKEHMTEHDSLKKNYVCESCGRVFTRQDYLHKHRLTHTGTKQHTCPHCNYRTAQKSSLTVHIRKHTGDRPYSCDLCPQRCISSSNLRAHRRRHLGDKTFECTICQKKFGYKISLEEHVASVHERSQAFFCELCGALYTRARGLRRHIHAKHGKQKDKPQPIDGANQEVSNPKDVVSSKCENVYLKILGSEEKKVSISENTVYEIKEGEEFVLLNAESGVILTKMY